MSLQGIRCIFTNLRGIYTHRGCGSAKQVTRFASTVVNDSKDQHEPKPDDSHTTSNDPNTTYINPGFVNRNPRNLERLGIARKSKGWKFQYPSREFYHRLMFERTNRHITGWVEHCSGRKVVVASTKEFCITKHLYSSTDVSAAQNIGTILGQRCMMAGISCMSVLEPLHGEHSEKYQAFQKAVTDSGVVLEEPEEVLPEYTPGIDWDNEWEVENLKSRQKKTAKEPKWTVFRYGQRRNGLKIKKYED